MKPNNEIKVSKISDFPPEKVAEWNRLTGYDKNMDKLMQTYAPQSKATPSKRRHDRKGGEVR